MDKPTRRRLYQPSSAMVDCLCWVKARFDLTEADTVRVLALLVGSMDDVARENFQKALEDVRIDMVKENVFERAALSIAVEQAAAVEVKQ